MIFENDKQLKDAMKFWQKELRLQDWDITVEFVRLFDMGREAHGHCHYVRPLKEAHIRIIDPKDVDGTLLIPFDAEQTLVHELLHIPICMFDDSENGSDKDILMEQFVNSMAKTLVKIKRGNFDDFRMS